MRTSSHELSQDEKADRYLQFPVPALGLDRARSRSVQLGSQGVHRTGSLRRQPSRRNSVVAESESYLQAKEFSVAEHLAQTPFLRYTELLCKVSMIAGVCSEP